MPVLPFYQFELKDKLNSKPQCFDSFNFLFLLQGPEPSGAAIS